MPPTEQPEGSPQNDAAFQARLQRLHDVINDLRPMAGPESLGRPFGEGYWLEEAMQTIFSRLKSPQDARQCDRIMAVELLANTKDDQMAQEIMAVMGSTPEATQRYELPAEARKEVEGLGGAAHTFLGQFEGPGNIWDLWEQRDDIVAEFLCWHTIARLRMATAGRMPRVQCPEFYETHEEYAPMPSLPADELLSVLRNGERLLACVSVGGVHAASHDFYPANPHVLVTDQRIGFLSRKGVMKKRLEEHVSWPLAAFTSRVNSSDGTALGPFMYFLTLFTQDGETVSVAFKNPADRDSYKSLVVEAIAPALG